jgi:hypothetical protein
LEEAKVQVEKENTALRVQLIELRLSEKQLRDRVCFDFHMRVSISIRLYSTLLVHQLFQDIVSRVSVKHPV